MSNTEIIISFNNFLLGYSSIVEIEDKIYIFTRKDDNKLHNFENSCKALLFI